MRRTRVTQRLYESQGSWDFLERGLCQFSKRNNRGDVKKNTGSHTTKQRADKLGKSTLHLDRLLCVCAHTHRSRAPIFPSALHHAFHSRSQMPSPRSQPMARPDSPHEICLTSPSSFAQDVPIGFWSVTPWRAKISSLRLATHTVPSAPTSM